MSVTTKISRSKLFRGSWTVRLAGVPSTRSRVDPRLSSWEVFLKAIPFDDSRRVIVVMETLSPLSYHGNSGFSGY